ncbi:MAG: MFS transporter [Oscillibacter sp.]|nr:MFS transporter [Oscillibacter sp.]
MFSFATKSDDPGTKLGWPERIGYGMGNYGIQWINSIMSAFFMVYLTNVAHLNVGIVGTLMAVSRVFDGVSDLIMGNIVDRTRSKHGKARVWLVRMCVPMAISTVLLFSIPAGMTEAIKYVYVFIFYNLVNAVFLTSMLVPYNSMNFLMSTDGYERGLLGNMNMIFQTLANISLNTFFVKILRAFGNGNEFEQRAWTLTTASIGVVVVVSSIIFFFGTKERVKGEQKQDAAQKDEVDPIVAVRHLFRNKYWIIMTICMFLIFFTIMMSSVGVSFYTQWNLGNLDYMAPINNAISIAQFAIMFATPFFMAKFGKHRTYQVGLVIMICGFVGTGIVGTNVPLLIVFNVLKGIGLGAAGGMAFGMVSDTIDYGEWKTGLRLVGMGNGGPSMAQKLGLGLGQAVMGWILAGVGFDETLPAQGPTALAGISFVYNWIPVICVSLCFVLMLFYHLDEEMPAIRAELDKRKDA